MWICSFSPDGRRVVSASNESVARLWDAANGELLGTLAGHIGAIRACGFSSNGERIVSASDDKTVKVWDAKRGLELPVDTGGRLTEVIPAGSFSRRWPDGQAIVSRGKSLTLWVAASAVKAHWDLAGHPRALSACAVTPDGRTLVTASTDGTLTLWENERESATLSGHTKRVTACVFSPDGKRIVSASEDATLRLWSRGRGRDPVTLHGHHDAVTGCAFSPDGSRIVSVSTDMSLRIWDAREGTTLRVLCGHARQVTACAFSPSAQWIVSASEDGTLKLWDAETGAEAGEYHPAGGLPLALDWAALPGIAIGTSSGSIELLRLEHPLAGPAVVPTWFQREGKIFFDCPICRGDSAVTASGLDGTVACQRCRRVVKLNPFAMENDGVVRTALTRALKNKAKAFKEFASETRATTHGDRCLVVAAWLHEAENDRAIMPDDVAPYYRKAGWRFDLANPRLPFRELKGRGLGELRNGRFSINQLGLAKVQEMRAAPTG